MGRSVVGGAAFLSTLAAIFLAALILLPSETALAQVTGAGDVAGSWKIETPSGHAPDACMNIAEGDVVTIGEVGSNELKLTLPSGESFQLTPTAPKASGALASWIGSGDVKELNFYGISKLAPAGETPGFQAAAQQHMPWQPLCSAVGRPCRIRKDPKTGSWVPWLLVPGVAGLVWVIYKGAKIGRTNSKKDSQRKQYLLDVGTQDNRTSLSADGEMLWVYAQVRCNRPEVDTAALTAALTFAPEGADANWLMLGTP